MPRKSVPPPPPPAPSRRSTSTAHSHPLLKGGLLAASAAPVAAAQTVTLGLVVVVMALLAIIAYLVYVTVRPPSASRAVLPPPTNGVTGLPPLYLTTVSSRNDPFNDPYSPPLKSDGMYFPRDSSDLRGMPPVVAPTTCNSGECAGAQAPTLATVPVGIPVNVQTRGYAPDYTQLGILTRERRDRTEDTSFRDNMILPLMGRRVLNGRDKYQYYTMSNTGAVNTKLPVRVRGKNCIGEYGCDELMNGDVVTVEGYNETFRATIYENSGFGYIPYL